MQVKIFITISDQTTEEKMTAAGTSREKVRGIYTEAFMSLLNAAIQPGATYDLRVEVTDNTKEGKE